MQVSNSQPPIVSIILPVYNGAKTLDRCLQAVCASEYPRWECIVVDDASTDGSREIASRYPVKLVELVGGPYGPAYARNRGAEVAQGEILCFLDSDVIVQSDTITRFVQTLSHNGVQAAFGSYDDSPEALDFLSRYKNLFHHYVHQQAGEEAVTFWSGCGAIRRETFVAVGGFDESRYTRPSIEDIELGDRLIASGHRILLNKEIQVKHLKRWTLSSMMKSDVVDRGIPWTQLLLEKRSLPNALNLRLSYRLSALLLYAVLFYLLLTAFYHRTVLLPLVVGLFLLVVGNWSDGRPNIQLSPRARAIAFILVIAIAALAVFFRVYRLLVPLGLLIGALIADRRLQRSSAIRTAIFFGMLVLGLAYALVIAFAGLAGFRTVPLLILLSTILVINARFYLFFARRLGILFALAVIPFHFFYYYYSVVAFVIGAARYAGRRLQKMPVSTIAKDGRVARIGERESAVSAAPVGGRFRPHRTGSGGPEAEPEL